MKGVLIQIPDEEWDNLSFNPSPVLKPSNPIESLIFRSPEFQYVSDGSSDDSLLAEVEHYDGNLIQVLEDGETTEVRPPSTRRGWKFVVDEDSDCEEEEEEMVEEEDVVGKNCAKMSAELRRELPLASVCNKIFITDFENQFLKAGIGNSRKVRFEAIPEKFARNVKKKLPENVTVIGPSGAKWNVGLVSSGDSLLFKHGWKEFVDDHSLKEDDLLIFRYNGESRFDVLIFSGQNFCERESSYFVRKCGHTELAGGFQIMRNMGKSPVEVGRDLTDCGVGSTPSKRSRLTNLGSKIMAGANNIMPHHGKHVVAQKVNSVAKDRSVGKYPLQYVSNRRPVTEEEKENVLHMAHAASTPDSVVVVMRTSHVYRRFFMTIPSEWVLSHLPRKSQDVILRVKEKENTWQAKYQANVGGSGGALTNGWKDFAFDNNLEESDVCLFELAVELTMELSWMLVFSESSQT